ncbi:PREDICTED: dual specificity protein phosphatase 8-like [Priapulus caudatus]|uniref:protein-tyrosine-phosphatase n=1 Tax=Priapulus caudatus TaxID=37621 RepID=A0ABM1EG61_PRICU|nr:PREDICTED: dual specificity protein phosphatase 8-like [Priapulus caudatus]XP_014671183.1 PREDICTED: dual specificity protein phosphatase 8-like [Priapulus caudatus]
MMNLHNMMANHPRFGSEGSPLGVTDAHHVAAVIKSSNTSVLIVDSRSFLEYNTCHIAHAINICCSKLVKRRLQQDKITVKELISQNCQMDAVETSDIIVYDEHTESLDFISEESFLYVLICKLRKTFSSVSLLQGGFLRFQAAYVRLCENKNSKCATMTTHSQPCLPVSSSGPTKILPFLFLGTHDDALNQQALSVLGISYVLNVTGNCSRSDFVQDNYFLRIPVNDNYSDKLLPWFDIAFQFLDKVHESHECVLVHCMAGVSRSPTFAIGYIMKHVQMSSDEAYRYVKDKRPVISPNFNFLGQLLEWERVLRSRGYKIQSGTPMRRPTVTPSTAPTPMVERLSPSGSPVRALAKLNFNQSNSNDEDWKEDIKGVKAIPTSALDKISFMPCLTSEAGIEESSPKLHVSCGVSGGSSVCRVRVTCAIDTPSTYSKPISARKPPLPVKPLLPVKSSAVSTLPEVVSASSPCITAHQPKRSLFASTHDAKDVVIIEGARLLTKPAGSDRSPVFVFGKTVESKKEPASPDHTPLFVFGKTVERRSERQTPLDSLKVATALEPHHPPRPCSISLSVQPDWGLCGAQKLKPATPQSACRQARKRFVTCWDGKLDGSVPEAALASHHSASLAPESSSQDDQNCVAQSDKGDFLGHRLEPSGRGSTKSACSTDGQSPIFIPIKRHLSCESQDSGLGPSPCRCEDCLGSSLDSVFELFEAEEPFVGSGGKRVGRNSMFYVDTIMTPTDQGILSCPESMTVGETESPHVAMPEHKKVYRSHATIQVL